MTIRDPGRRRLEALGWLEASLTAISLIEGLVAELDDARQAISVEIDKLSVGIIEGEETARCGLGRDAKFTATSGKPSLILCVVRRTGDLNRVLQSDCYVPKC